MAKIFLSNHLPEIRHAADPSTATNQLWRPRGVRVGDAPRNAVRARVGQSPSPQNRARTNAPWLAAAIRLCRLVAVGFGFDTHPAARRRRHFGGDPSMTSVLRVKELDDLGAKI